MFVPRIPRMSSLAKRTNSVIFVDPFYPKTTSLLRVSLRQLRVRQIYVYARNARFFESDEESSAKILEGHGSGAAGSTGKTAEGEDGKFPAPSLIGVPGLVTVKGPPLAAPKSGSLVVVFFFATWCDSCEKVLPAFLAVAARYGDEGEWEAGW